MSLKNSDIIASIPAGRDKNKSCLLEATLQEQKLLPVRKQTWKVLIEKSML